MRPKTVRSIRFSRSLAVPLALVMTTSAGLFPAFGQLSDAATPAVEPLNVSVTIPTGGYRITGTAQGHEVFAEGFGYLLVPGKPALPSRVFAVAIPPGAKVVDVDFETDAPVDLPGVYDVVPAALPRVIGEEDPAIYELDRRRYDENHESVYGGDGAYPPKIVEFVRTAGYRKYDLVDVRVTPFSYRPLSGRLTYYPEITVRVHYTLPEKRGAAMVDNLVSTERIAQDIMVNDGQAKAWYPRGAYRDKGVHDFVIITLDSLTSSITSLVDWEASKGRTVEVVTTSWIDSNYTGYDLAERIRNFLREKYPSSEWGIEDVLLIGHYDDVPMRRTAVDLGYGRPETDLYYAELSLPDDQSWDSDGDHQYGEYSDSVDFYAEINVGRIPWSTASTVQSICEKSVAYEQNEDPAYKKNMLLLAAFFWNDDPNPRTDNAELMEAKIDQPGMADWTFTRLYEKNSECWSSYECDYPMSHGNVMSVWPNGTFGFVNWAGHGSPTSTHVYGLEGEAFIQSFDCTSLDDDYPAIIFADACSNSDTDYVNLGQAMMKQGAVGFVGATKVAYGCPGWDDPYDGSSQSMDFFFTTRVISGDYTQGQAHQEALRMMYTNGLWDDSRYEMYEWGALWGNPNLGMGPVPSLRVLLAGPPPEYVDPGVPTMIDVEILNGAEEYVPDTGLLHYRFDGGTFLTAPLIYLGGTSYRGTVPGASCGTAPEYYISAQGNGGGIVSNPKDAPATVYSSIVGSVLAVVEHDFETDQGWTVEDSVGLVDGTWDRGVPVNCNRGDPPSDYDGSGQCYLTDNSAADACNSDVDDGTTWLVSPTIDLGDGDADVNFVLWYTNNYGADPYNDLFKIDVSNDDGGSWTPVETVGPDSSGGWVEHTFTVGDFVSPTSQVKVRFEASDLNSGSVVEAGVDSFSVTRLECVPPCPAAERPLPANEIPQACTGDEDCANRATCIDGVCYVAKNRYISFVPNNGGTMVAFRVTHVGTGRRWWVAEPFAAPQEPGTWLARLADEPVWRVWDEPFIHVGDCAIVPVSGYEVQAIDLACAPPHEASFSPALTLPTTPLPLGVSQWADCVGECLDGQWTPPDGFVNFNDISAATLAFQRVPSAPWPVVTWVDLHGNDFGDPTVDPPNGLTNFADIQQVVLSFQGNPYPFVNPADCP